MDLLIVSLKVAFRQPGCPICRLRRESERRYLFGFLWENVNDAGVRVKLVNSLGFCRRHAWQLQAMEERVWGDGLGTAIVYEDLVRRAHAALQNSTNHNRVPSGLRPRAQCRVCEIGENTEQSYVTWLLRGCKDAEFRKWYRSSDGVCLPHLRHVFAVDGEQTRAAKSFLIETAVEKLHAGPAMGWMEFLVGRRGPEAG